MVSRVKNYLISLNPYSISEQKYNPLSVFDEVIDDKVTTMGEKCINAMLYSYRNLGYGRRIKLLKDPTTNDMKYFNLGSREVSLSKKCASVALLILCPTNFLNAYFLSFFVQRKKPFRFDRKLNLSFLAFNFEISPLWDAIYHADVKKLNLLIDNKVNLNLFSTTYKTSCLAIAFSFYCLNPPIPANVSLKDKEKIILKLLEKRVNHLREDFHTRSHFYYFVYSLGKNKMLEPLKLLQKEKLLYLFESENQFLFCVRSTKNKRDPYLTYYHFIPDEFKAACEPLIKKVNREEFKRLETILILEN